MSYKRKPCSSMNLYQALNIFRERPVWRSASLMTISVVVSIYWVFFTCLPSQAFLYL